MDKGTLSTQKNVTPLVGLFQPKWKSSFVAFVKNEGVDEDDKQNWVGSKLIVTWSQSTRCHGLTIFENEAVMWLRHLLFIVRYFLNLVATFPLLNQWKLMSTITKNLKNWEAFEEKREKFVNYDENICHLSFSSRKRTKLRR